MSIGKGIERMVGDGVISIPNDEVLQDSLRKLTEEKILLAAETIFGMVNAVLSTEDIVKYLEIFQDREFAKGTPVVTTDDLRFLFDLNFRDTHKATRPVHVSNPETGLATHGIAFVTENGIRQLWVHTYQRT